MMHKCTEIIRSDPIKCRYCGISFEEKNTAQLHDATWKLMEKGNGEEAYRRGMYRHCKEV